MYLNNFCFVLVLVTVSASYLDRELPLYLSDDILISKLPSISKRSILDEFKAFSKRDVTEVKTVNTNENKNNENNHEGHYIEDGEESGLVFIPTFGRRSKRSVNEDDQNVSKTKKPTTTSSDEKKIEGEQANKEKKGTEIEKEEESGLVFIPSFGRRTRRSVSENNNEKLTDNLKALVDDEQKKDETNEGSEIENEEESGLVFIPSFGRRTRRSVPNNDDLFDAESNIVFLPSFRRNGIRRFRRDLESIYYRHYNKRSVEKPDQTKNAPVTERNEELSDSDTVNEQESGLVFLPSFGRRSRRSIVQSQPTSFTKQTAKDETTTSFSTLRTKRETDQNKNVPVTERNEKSSDSDNFNEQESGLVFLPSFGRRLRRSVVQSQSTSSTQQKTKEETTSSTPALITKRETVTKIPDDKKAKDDNFNEDGADESEEESGLVFIPSFGRRQRRDTSSTSKSQENRVPDVSQPIKDVPNQKKTFSGQESGLVFLPSFNRRTRRDTKEEKPKKSDDSSKNYDVEQQESGLVFLPSFGRRT